MLLTKFVEIKWNSKIYKHYKDLGYEYTKMGDTFMVSVNDLTRGSNAIVQCSCDYCKKIFSISWFGYCKLKKKENNSDCCSNSECTTKKSQETLMKKYGTTNIREIPNVNEKIKETNLEKYGSENPFGNKEIQEKIKKYYLDNYGVEHNMQLKECVEKVKTTCIEKYGVENFTQTLKYREMFRGENSPVWKGDAAATIRNGRELPEYRDWRKSVFDRDLYKCQCCGARNGNGKFIRLEAHHLFNWKDNVELRYDINNGVTLCQDCHVEFHKIYKKNNNTKNQFEEFVKKYKIDEKIC